MPQADRAIYEDAVGEGVVRGGGRAGLRGLTQRLPKAFMWQAPGQTPHRTGRQHWLPRNVPGEADAPGLTGEVLGSERLGRMDTQAKCLGKITGRGSASGF